MPLESLLSKLRNGATILDRGIFVHDQNFSFQNFYHKFNANGSFLLVMIILLRSPDNKDSNDIKF